MIAKIRKFILISGDIICAYLSLLLTIIFGFWKGFDFKILNQHLFPFSLLYLLWLLSFYVFDLYGLETTRAKFLFYPRLVWALTINFILGIVLFYSAPIFGITPKTNLILNILFFGALILIWRKTFYAIFSSRLMINVGILGLNKITQKLAGEIISRPYLGYRLKIIFDGKIKTIPFLKGIKILKAKNNFLEQIRKEPIDVLIVGENIALNPKIGKSLYDCLPARITFFDVSKAYEIICQKIPLSAIKQGWFLENLREGEKFFYDKIKRIFDLIFSLIISVIIIPFWALIILAIKIEDNGIIFYKQKRVGKDKKEFWLFKFRSMKENAEKETGPVFAQTQDPRVTKVGKFLRKTHLDETPQLINVLKGDASLVGPRPERPEFVKELEKQVPHYHLRHLIKPGVTGWAQIKFRYARNTGDSFEKFQYDLYYLKNRNLLLDVAIFLRTMQTIFSDF